jgi:hypothetical protein
LDPNLLDFFFFNPDSEAIGFLTSNIRSVACLRFGAWLLVPLGAAVRVLFALGAVGYLCSVPRGAAAGRKLQNTFLVSMLMYFFSYFHGISNMNHVLPHGSTVSSKSSKSVKLSLDDHIRHCWCS